MKSLLSRYAFSLTLALLMFVNIGRLFAQEFLIPETLGVQYAGSIGYGSVSFGYQFFKKDKGSLDFNYGYVPENKGGVQNLGTVKFAYRPINIAVKEWAVISPINPGVFVSYDFDQEIKRNEGQYPKGYYWWNEAVRTHLSVSSELKLDMKKLFKKPGIKNLSIYSEFNTNDLYAVSWFKNRDELSFFDIVKTGYGMKVYF